ncbi:hypothetical protein [Mycolicibacterium pyrenivorans]|uniref:hypothetical protein n=1 Tax=Mycolicibacterium pyrenivorans TaxID=187102 RepID=UPI0021F395BB|nr:hypothetical protein [Mycolicibacterium pyrenivorans]MCV7150445.1 hypothetical protein [Mycolicibacterium pyrenivorans]
MATTERTDGAAVQLDEVAWQFLRSEFAGAIYVDWPIDRRLDAFLRRHSGRAGYRALHDDGTAYNALLDRVMANIAPALREGILPSASPQGKP